jgi:hypothetical protein
MQGWIVRLASFGIYVKFTLDITQKLLLQILDTQAEFKNFLFLKFVQ